MVLRHAKTHRLTLGEARQAARVAKGSRPTGTFIDLHSGKAKALRERYLGEIVHIRGDMTSGKISSAHSARVTRKVAKKK